MHDFKNNIFKLDSKSGKITKVAITKQERIDLINDLNILPGEQELDGAVLLARSQADKFDKYGYYTDVIPNTRDYISFWEIQKEMCYAGLLIDNKYYITGDAYWYFNFIQIPDKVKGYDAFPRIFDTDIWWFQLLELAELSDRFSVTLKKRQMGFSLKAMAKIIKRFWFEQGFVGRIACWDEKYVKDNWGIIKLYYNFLNKSTAWTRPVTGDKMSWTQEIKMDDGTSRGLGSKLQGLVYKNNPAKIVGGKVDEIILDESGVAPNLDEVIEFGNSALKFGNQVTGHLHAFGAVGRLKDSQPLKTFIYNPIEYNFLDLPNTWGNKPDQRVGIFVPEYYSYGNCIDEFGNSKIEDSKIEIEKEGLKAKKKSYKSYMIYKSQSPSTIEEAFATREENLFPVEIIQPYFDFIEQNYKPFKVELIENQYGITHRMGSKFPIVEEFPVKKGTIKVGAVVIEEPPLPNSPFGLYYAGVDTITPLKTTTSSSLQSIYIYKAAHELDGEFTMDKCVAWFAGRSDDAYETFQTTLDLIKYYNCRALIENDNRNFIEWMIGQKQQQYMMKRNEIALGRDLILRSTIDTSEYGFRTGTKTMKEYLWSLAIEYVEEVIGERFNEVTGKATPIYGVERIKDKMLLKEMLEFTPKKNCDRLMSFCISLLAAKSNTNRGIKVSTKTRETPEKVVNYSKQLSNSMFRPRTKLNPFRR